MIFIKETKIKELYGHNVIHAIFMCKYCKKIIEKPKYLGKRNKSCGCISVKLRSEKMITHGESGNKSRLYRIWRGMKARCNCPSKKEMKYYKNKNIKVYKQWNDHYIMFKIWALCHGYKDNLTIERISNDGNYEPSNCKWITIKEQAHNRSNNKLNWITVKLIRELYNCKYTIEELFKIFDISKQNLRRILTNKRWQEEVI